MLLVTSSSRPEQWIVPGGGIEPEEEPSATAIREVVEEAGVVGQLHRRLGTFEDRVSKFWFNNFVWNNVKNMFSLDSYKKT